MAKTLSIMPELGMKAPEFSLFDVRDDSLISFYEDNKHPYKGSVVMFICNHCPYVKHLIYEIVNLANDYKEKGIRFFAINSNDISNYPDDSPHNMKKLADSLIFPFPYLFDATQEIAKAYNAACTPDFFVFDSENKLVYRGQFDDSRPGNDMVPNGESLRNALDYLLNNEPVPAENQKPGIGCGIKWKRDNLV